MLAAAQFAASSNFKLALHNLESALFIFMSKLNASFKNRTKLKKCFMEYFMQMVVTPRRKYVVL